MLWPFAAIGLVVPGVSQILIILAVRYAGPSRAAILVGTAPLGSVLLALALLDEPLRPALLAGTALIVAGGVALAFDPGRPVGFRMLGVVLALVCAALFAGRDNAVRWVARDVVASAAPGDGRDARGLEHRVGRLRAGDQTAGHGPAGADDGPRLHSGRAVSRMRVRRSRHRLRSRRRRHRRAAQRDPVALGRRLRRRATTGAPRRSGGARCSQACSSSSAAPSSARSAEVGTWLQPRPDRASARWDAGKPTSLDST